MMWADVSPAPQARASHRRRVLLTALSAAAAPVVAGGAPARDGASLKAVAFDAFPIFDPRAVFAVAETAFPERGAAFWRDWFQAIFADTWLRTSAHRYSPFLDLVAERLDADCHAGVLSDRPGARDQVLAAFSAMPVWPDVKEQLTALRTRDVRLVVLSNLSDASLHDNLRRNGIEPLFEAVLSTDRARAFKPAPQAYAMAMAALRLRKHEIGFAAFAPWDAAGASWFGYPTAWVNRQAQQPEPGARAMLTGPDLGVVAELVCRPSQAFARPRP